MSDLPILIILHRSCGDMGRLGNKLKNLGYQVDIRCAIEGDSLPDPSNYYAVICFGGVMSVNDYEKIPAIRKEIEWIPSVIEANVRYLGICLGAQLLAKALGAGVSKKADNQVEIGFYKVYPTDVGRDYFPEKGQWFYQWHVEGFSVPKNCQRLAESEFFPNQAFKLNDRVIGIQFHPEATREMIDCWVLREPENLRLKGAQSYKTQVELQREYNNSIDQWLDTFICKWLDHDIEQEVNYG